MSARWHFTMAIMMAVVVILQIINMQLSAKLGRPIEVIFCGLNGAMLAVLCYLRLRLFWRAMNDPEEMKKVLLRTLRR